MSQGFNLLYTSVDDTEFTYKIKNEEIATVAQNSGIITSVKKGKTQIEVKDKVSGQMTCADIYVLGADDITFPQIESNYYATVTLKANGEVWSYGYNGYGQLGTGDTQNRTLPTYAGINNIVQIALGNNHTLAVDTDGHVWAWGYNNYGQLGNGTTGGVVLEKSLVKSPDGKGVLENIVAVAAGDSFSIALDKDGNVYSWGYNGYGALGLSDTNERHLPVKVDTLQDITKIKAANQSAFAIDSNNHLWASGYNGYGNLGDGTTGDKSTFTENITFDNVADIAPSTSNSTLLLTLDGSVWGFGNSANSALTNVGGAIPQQLQGPDGVLSNVTAIATGTNTGYAITSDEKVVAWGLNNYSQLASLDKETKSVPVYMKDKDGNDLTNVMIVSGGIYNTEIALNDGTVWSIGYNGYGQLGDASTVSQEKIECISTKYMKLQETEITLKLSSPDYQITPQVVYGFNLLYDETESDGFTYETLDSSIAVVGKDSGKVTALRNGRTYIIVRSKDSDYEARLIVNVIAEDKKTVEKVEAGNIHSLALKQNGTVWAWGDNSYGQMGNGQINSVKTLEPTQVKTGVYTEIIKEVTPDGSVQVTTTKIDVNLDNVKDIAAGNSYNLLLNHDGYVYSWGYNGYGQLGNNTTESIAIPTRIDGLENIEKVYAFGNTSIAINKDGEIYVWGYEYSQVPTKLNFHIKAIDIHKKLILAEDGTVWYLSNTPSRVPELRNIVEVASGDGYYSALDTKGQVWVWGSNNYGQLSQGDTENVSLPVLAKVIKETNEDSEEVEYEVLKDIVEIVAGNNNIYMISNTGVLYVSGYNGKGQLGIAKSEEYITSVAEARNMNQVKFVDSDNYHSIASDKSGFVYTAGYNSYGELGNGNCIDRNEFVVIGDTYVHLTENVVSVEEGKTKQVGASLDNKFNLIQDTVDSAHIVYESLNNEVATVDSDGTIHAKQLGTVEIIVTHTVTHKSATIFVLVVPEGKTTVPKVEISNTHMAALKADGTVWTWGNNNEGQLGTGDNVSKASPVRVTGIEDAVNISAGYYDTVIVKADGTVWSFGHNAHSQLGDGTGSNRNKPVQLSKNSGGPLNKIVKVSAGKYRTVALDEDGYVWIWGYGYNSFATKIEALENIIDISPNYAVNQIGEVFKIDSLEKLNISNIIRVSEGLNHTVFLSKDSTGYALGNNDKGQLGNGTLESSAIPVVIKDSNSLAPLSEIKELKAGDEVSIAIMKNGDTYTWGSNEDYKLGMENVECQALPRKNDKTNKAIFADAGPNNSAIIDTQGFVYTWGLGDNGSLGNKLYNSSSVPVLVGQEDVGLNENDIVIHKGEKFQVVVTNKTFNVIKEVKDESKVSYSIGNSDIATINQDGIVTGVKEGKTTVVVNKVGTNINSIANVTVLPDGVDIEPMALTCMSHTVVLKADGTVWSYGLNSSYELGNGTTISSDIPVKVKFPDGIVIKQIAIGNTHNLALDTDGNVWGWGTNANNSLGTTSSTPVNLGIKNIKKISANNDQSMALTEDGYVYVWGLNENGELGVGTYEAVKEPTLINYVSGILDMAIGRNHAILLTTEGKVLTTGLNVYGQTAKDSGKSNQFTEIEVPAIIGKISAGDNHSVLLSANGDVYAFGYNSNGQLGTGTKQNITVPTKINVTNIMNISAGKNHTILLGADRKLYSAGANEQGQLGIGNKDEKLLFTEITTVNDMMYISAGNTYNVAIKYDGDVYGFGDYYHGLENIRTRTNSKVPVKVGNDSIFIEEPEITVNVEGLKQINITPRYSFNVFYDDEDESNFEYNSINKEIATVDKNGLVTGVHTGTTWVKVTDKVTSEENIIMVRVIEKDAKYAPQVVGGDGYTVVLKADGTIWSFGYNSDGQLGNDELAPINIPSQTNIIATYKQIVAGQKFTLALRDDGTVWAWGDNTYGVLGQGNSVSAKKPVQVQSLSNIIAISAGDNHAIALDSFGNVYTWGLNSSGQLGNGNTQTLRKPELLNSTGNQIVSISAGGDLTAMVDVKGNVYIFGDNSNEQIEEFKYNYDSYGQQILPATNLYVAEAKKIDAIDNVVKVDCLSSGIVALRADGSVVKISKYATEDYASVQTISQENMVDISATSENVMTLDKYGNCYAYGDNTYGQVGISSTSDYEGLQKVNMIEDKTYLSIGTGYRNNYMIDTEGFVFGAGLNEYGQLGNGNYEDSTVFTLVGDRKFEIEPKSKLMVQPEEETVKVKANIFNVFNHNERKLTDYEWKSNNTDVATVKDGVITAQDMGTTTITAIDKATGAEATALRVIQPLDEQRIDSITVNNKLAEVSGENKYQVSVTKTANGKGIIRITTKNVTDAISIDGGQNYSVATLEKEIDLDTNPKVVKIKVKVSNGKVLDYTLTINVLSNDASLLELTVGDVQAKSIGAKEYEIIIKDTVTKPEVHAVTKDKNAMVSIDAGVKEKNQTTKTVDMVATIKKTIPIQVTTESGEDVTYTLTIYKENALTELQSIVVNDVEATKLSENNYKVIIDENVDSAEIIATTLYPQARVELNALGEDVNVTTRIIGTTKNETIVKIYVRVGSGVSEQEAEYTLTIDKKGTEDLQGLFSVTVNGVDIKPVGKIYNAYISEDTTKATIEAITISAKDIVKIGDSEPKVHKASLELTGISDTILTYTITVTDPDDVTQTKEYTLNIKKPSADNTLMSVTVGNKEFAKEAKRKAGTNIYTVNVSDKYSKIDVIAKANYELTEVSVDHKDYEKQISTREVKIESLEPTKVDIWVKALNGDIEKYVLEIYKENSNNNLEHVYVDGNEVLPNKDDKYTYEYTLDKITDKLTIGAVTEDTNAMVGINSNEKEKNVTYRQVKMVGRQIIVNIVVTAEDGTAKTYRLIVNALPDNVNIMKVKVNGKEAEAVPVNEYVARVNKNAKDFELYVIPEDEKAKVKIDNNSEVVGTANAIIAKNSDVVKVPIKIIAQDGTTQEYILTVSNQSDDCGLAILKVNGEILEVSEDGNYHVNRKFLDKAIDVEAIANNSHASVSINGTTPTEEKQLSNVTIPDLSNTIIVKVIAEDGTTKDYYLIVDRLPNETGVNIIITYEEAGVQKQAIGKINESGEGVFKVGNPSEVTMKVVAKDVLASVAIESELPKLKEATKNIITSNETTSVPVQVIAQDGTIKNYDIKIVKASSNNNLQKLEAKDVKADDIIKTSDNSYVIKMPDTMNELELTATAESEFAKVKIDEADYSNDNVAKHTVKVEENKVISIFVKAETGEVKEYTVNIQKVTDLRLEKVKVDGNECIQEDGIYIGFIDKGVEEAALSITPKNAIALVATKQDNEDNWSDKVANPIHIKNINISGDDTKVLIQVQDPKDDSRIEEYTVIIKYKSPDASMQIVEVDDKDAIKIEDYYYSITSSDAVEAKIHVKATNKYAKVSIGAFEEEQGESTRNVTLDSSKITTVVVTITSQDGKNKNTFNVVIERKSKDTSCTILVNDEEVDEIDSETNTYTKYIERNLEKATILVTANSDVAKLEMAGKTAIKTISSTVDIVNEVTVVDVIVTAENGDKETYHINIVKKSTNNEIKTVKVDGKVIEEDKDGRYVAIVFDKGKGTQDALIEVIASEEHAKIQIGDATGWQDTKATSTVTFKDGNRVIKSNIKVQAQDGTTEVLTKELEIKLISDDASIKVVRNGDSAVEEYDEETHTFTEFIDKDIEDVSLSIEANSEYTTLTSGLTESKGVLSINNIDVKGKESLEITFTAIAESGRTVVYTIKLERKSNNANIETLLVDGVNILDKFEDIDSIPSCIISIPKNKDNTLIEIVTENPYANIKVGDAAPAKGKIKVTIPLDTEKSTITVPIVITSQDGEITKTYNIIFIRFSDDTGIEKLQVNEKVVIPNSDGNYEVTLKATEDIANVKITLSSIYATVTMGGEEHQGSLEENVILTKSGDTIKNITVTAMDGTIKMSKLIIHKRENNLGLDKVYLNNRLASKIDDTTYQIDVKEGTTIADIKAIAKNSKEFVSIKGNAQTEGTNTYKNCSLEGLKVPIKVISMFEDEIEQEKEYTLIIKEVKQPNYEEDLGVTIKVNDEELVPDGAGNFVKVVSQDEDNATLLALVKSETSKVKIKDENSETEFLNPSAQKNISLQENITMVTVTTQNGALDEHEYKVYIIKDSEDVQNCNLKQIIAGTGAIDEGPITANADGTYTAVVKAGERQIELTAIAEYPYSRVSIDGDVGIIGSNTRTINMKNTKEKQVIVKITSLSGEEKEYIVNISRQPEDLELEKVLVNNNEAEMVDDNNYKISIVKGRTQIDIKAITYANDEYVSIAGNEKTVKENIFEDYELSNGLTISIIVSNGLDETETGYIEKEYILTIEFNDLSEITGKVITQAVDKENQTATILLYKSDDTRKEDDLQNPREIVKEITINPDGTYELIVEPGEYDMVIRKTSYLEYRLTNIVVAEGEVASIDDIYILAGDVVETGEIEIDDLVAVGDNYGVVITDANKGQKGKYDLNEDGIVDLLDRSIVKDNYTEKVQKVKWVKPRMKVRMLTAELSTDSEQIVENIDGNIINETEEIGVNSEEVFILPIACDYRITDDYGYRIHPVTEEESFHTGIDLAGDWHTEIFAVADGEVTFSGVQNGFGNCIEIKHEIDGKEVYSFYAHLSEIQVEVGDKVMQGDVIGLEGGDPVQDENPGFSTGHHLHFEIRNASGYKNDVNPKDYINF